MKTKRHFPQTFAALALAGALSITTAGCAEQRPPEQPAPPAVQAPVTQPEPELKIRGGYAADNPGQAAVPASAGGVTTTRTVETAPPQTEVITYVKDGKTITETITRSTTAESVSEVAAPKTYKVAFLTYNRAGKSFDEKLPAIDDLVSSRIADEGVLAISRNQVIDTARMLDSAFAARSAADPLAVPANFSAALRRELGADFLLEVSLTNFGKSTRTIKAYGTERTIDERTLTLSYKISDGATGVALTGDTVRVSRKENQSQFSGVTEGGEDILNGLLEEAVQKIADSVRTRVESNRIASAASAAGVKGDAAATATVTIIPEIADLTVPDIRLGPGNTVLITSGASKVQTFNVTVEVDGIAIGSAPGQIRLPAGQLSKLRLTREGYNPVERTIKPVDGTELAIAMSLTDANLARWKELTSFISDLKDKEKLTDAEAEVLKGKAQMLRQSGFKVDYKVDTKDNIRIGASIF
ncbi:MAG: PEGA domain-containing protein [Opitutaceae bacterium]|jgi:hypothetical protein|nr:PEGA domain-containing protein [Opitutaceae bacterium]